MPATVPAAAESRTAEPRRPAPGVVSTSPAALSSRTMLETVAGASPVVRASSAWVYAVDGVPSAGASATAPRSTSRTRCWLATRSEEVEPGAERTVDMGEACPSGGITVKS